MRSRPAARLLVIDSAGKVLLFRFRHRTGALAGNIYWATPGGGVESGETFEQAASRELQEETGLITNEMTYVAQRNFIMSLSSGELVNAEERFYLVRAVSHQIDATHWSTEEKQVIDLHHWWSEDELATTREIVYPTGLAEMLAAI
ncbi:NUDIX hydrolase [Serratia odorifera]|jgi:8-oxo-dGTP pyrophosphatase MutT (NUDIX family)|uniref:Hydrolase, NUDIX family n=2 Tax=Serratia odorifera TaxID=618 RepID=D4E6I9_SEROD|nr:NUDIX domain-containing protein [Serratia odorifera]EFE94555.1 hydrolase, NUDIX family [Serratia odorifera DSM 4582]PNK89397.1 NUDIX domain-containing protein [Serratia odorifera]RII70358.1 NUDIX domain-containing protein [Serratia odorifera]VDZ63436.1 Nucleoside triphosphatase nudI [Serratia odorifera]HEJ9093621.1 NUDIX domain-containing protein [Serratia odorifera]